VLCCNCSYDSLCGCLKGIVSCRMVWQRVPYNRCTWCVLLPHRCVADCQLLAVSWWHYSAVPRRFICSASCYSCLPACLMCFQCRESRTVAVVLCAKNACMLKKQCHVNGAVRLQSWGRGVSFTTGDVREGGRVACIFKGAQVRFTQT
jgi:hypothetical protein